MLYPQSTLWKPNGFTGLYHTAHINMTSSLSSSLHHSYRAPPIYIQFVINLQGLTHFYIMALKGSQRRQMSVYVGFQLLDIAGCQINWVGELQHTTIKLNTTFSRGILFFMDETYQQNDKFAMEFLIAYRKWDLFIYRI